MAAIRDQRAPQGRVVRSQRHGHHRSAIARDHRRVTAAVWPCSVRRPSCRRESVDAFPTGNPGATEHKAEARLVVSAIPFFLLILFQPSLRLSTARSGTDLESFLDGATVQHHWTHRSERLSVRCERRSKRIRRRRSKYDYRSRGVRDLSRQVKFRGCARGTSRRRIPE